jgi:hypothetical protein
MRRDRLGLACRALQRRHIGHCTVVGVRCDAVVGNLKLAHDSPPVILACDFSNHAMGDCPAACLFDLSDERL